MSIKELKKISYQIANILSKYMDPHSAQERANNIAQLYSVEEDVDVDEISHMLVPNPVKIGITCGNTRKKVSKTIQREIENVLLRTSL